MNLRNVTFISGLGGSILITLATMITAIPYRSRLGEHFSFLNRYISELGEIGVSELAWVFNAGLFIGGLILVAYMMGVGLIGRHWPLTVIGVIGTISAISCALIGVFPINRLDIHIDVAMTYFRLGLLTVFLFSGYVLLVKQSVYPKWLAIPGGVTAVCFAAFLWLPDLLMPGQPILPPADQFRSTLMLTALLEWLVFFSVLGWIVSVSVYLWRLEQQTRKA